MSMREYAMQEKAAFLVDPDTAILIHTAMYGDAEPFDWYFLLSLPEKLDGVRYSSDFAGDVSSLFPEQAKVPLELELEDDPVAFLPSKKEADLFSAAYGSKEELRQEFEDFFSSHGIRFPEDFDWWRNIVSINGTIFC